MIQSFACKVTSLLWAGHSSRKLHTRIQQVALRKLAVIDIAQVAGVPALVELGLSFGLTAVPYAAH